MFIQIIAYIDFEKNTIVKNDSIFFKIPLKSVTPGTYEYVRVSLAYQNYEVKFLLDTNINVGGTNYPIYCICWNDSNISEINSLSNNINNLLIH